MDRQFDSALNRRRFLRYGGALGAGGLLFGSADAVAASESVDDHGNPIDDPEPEAESSGSMDTASVNVASWSTLRPTAVEAESPPDGRIVSNRYAWRTPGASRTGNEHALELEDRGGVDVGFRLRTTGSLTIDFHWRHRSGRSLAYAFNDQDSASSGFRAFTNSIAGRGMWFRNPFGGSDVVYRGNLQDGRWHWIRVVLDAEARTYTAYVDGQRVGRSYYHGRGWTSDNRCRIMGRYSGTRTRIEYDRYVVADEAVHLDDEVAIDGTLVHYELEEAEGRTLTNGSGDRSTGTHPLVARKTTLIESIRSDAGRILAGPDVARIDGRAERLLERIDAGFDRADAETRTQYERALERMVVAEEVTQTATESGIEPAHRIARATVDLGLARAASLILGRTLRAMGWTARRIASILSEIASMAGRTLNAVTGRVLLPIARRRELDHALSRIERRVSELLEAHGSAIESIGKKLLSKSITAVIHLLPEEVLDTLERIREEFIGVIERIFYGSFQFDSELTSLKLGIPGVNVSVENAMGTVSDGIDDGSLGGEWDEERSMVSERIREEIRSREVVFVGGMKTAENEADRLGAVSLASAVLGLGLFTISICLGATGLGLAASGLLVIIAAKLKLGAAALGKIALALTVSISLVGIAFLTWTANRHDETIIGLVAPDPLAQVVNR